MHPPLTIRGSFATSKGFTCSFSEVIFQNNPALPSNNKVRLENQKNPTETLPTLTKRTQDVSNKKHN